MAPSVSTVVSKQPAADTPLVPLEPELPEVPLLPDEPDVPLLPDEPDVPLLPEEPEVPDEPEEPDVPLLPDEPDVPDEPLEPDVPLLPEEPDEPATVKEKYKPSSSAKVSLDTPYAVQLNTTWFVDVEPPVTLYTLLIVEFSFLIVKKESGVL